MTFRQLISYILYFFPAFARDYLKAYYQKRQLKMLRARYRKTKVRKDDIIVILDKLNLDKDIFLHTSTISIGKIDARIKDLGELILEKVNINKNTLLISALPFRGRFKDYLDERPVFDVKNSPVEMGAINEYLSFLPGALRSLHPTHSVAAIGPKASYYISEHHFDITPFGVHSPYYKLIDNDAKILMFGAGLNYLTFPHVVEDILSDCFPVNPYLKEIYTVKVINASGDVVMVDTKCHDPFKAIKRDGYILLPYFIKYNAIEKYPLGESEVLLLDAKRVVYSYYLALLDGISVYGKFFLRKKTRVKVLEQLELIR
jgi:aminoglycoside 3-N-acetyltransferase